MNDIVHRYILVIICCSLCTVLEVLHIHYPTEYFNSPVKAFSILII